MRAIWIPALLAALVAGGAFAGEADVLEVVATKESEGLWRFDVTVRHDDAGWDHYADAWEVRTLDGTVLGTRTLLHPHDTEQPFTRSLNGVEVPDGVTEVEVVARDKVHGYGGETVRVTLDD